MSLADYSDLEKEIKESQAPSTLPSGTEVKFRVISVREGTSEKNGAHYYMPVYDVPDHPNCAEFSDFFWDLADRDKLEPKQAARLLNQFKVFAECIGLDYSKPFSWSDDIPGLTGWAILGVKKSDEYGDSNSIKKYLARK
jgi:hypothetical protein